MKFEIYTPSDQLKPYVKQFVISENDEAQTYKVLPGTSLVMGFQYSGRLSYQNNITDIPLASAGVTGLLDGYRIFQNTAHTGTVLVIFHEAGAAQFFTNPVNELFRESLSLEHLFSAAVLDEARERLSAAGCDKDRIAVIEALLLAQLRDVPADLMVYKALQFIHHSKGTIRITELAEKLNTSQSPLEKRFRKIVGASPKKFASIVRVKNVIAALDHGDQDAAAFLAGYYDQAHFIKDFKTFTADTPEQYLKAVRQGQKGK
jgi:AraC-like DNA-binding protein